MIWISKKKIVVDCFTSSNPAYDLFPIDYAIKFVPDWWRNMPKEYEVNNLFPSSTMKRCPAIIESFKHGLMIPLWSDLAVSTKGGNDWELKFSDPMCNIEMHNANQWKAYADPDKYIQFKLMSPWAMQTKEEIMWSYSKPAWTFSPDSSLHILGGILNFKTQHSTHVNMLMPLATAPNFIVQAGQPMVHLLPLSDKVIEVRRHLITPNEFSLKFSNQFNFSFTKAYKRAVAIKKEMKCPFKH